MLKQKTNFDQANLELRISNPIPHPNLRLIYAPWTYLVYIPFLLFSTALWGSLAFLLAAFNLRLAFFCGTIWAWCLCKINFTTVQVQGLENINPGQAYVIMANHRSHFDVLAFYGHWRKQFRWVMKQELRRVPFLGPACAAIGNVFIDRSNRLKAIESLRAAKPLFDSGISVLVFPEGSRSPDGRLRPFKKGGFMLALEVGVPILPVTINGTREILPDRSFKLLPGRIRIQIHPPIDPCIYKSLDREQLMAKVSNIIASKLPPEAQPLNSALK